MAVFGSSRSNKGGSQNKKPQRDVFSRYGGRLTQRQFEQRMHRVPLRPEDKEYVKRVMERFDNPHYSRGITKDEFQKGLDEMLKNTRDPIDRQKIERLREHFEK